MTPMQASKNSMKSWSDTRQNIIHAIILLVIFLILIWVVPSPKHNAHGIYLPQTTEQFPVSKQIELVNQAPAGLLPIGMIRTAIHFSSTSPAALKANDLKNLKLALHLASQHGANLLVGTALITPPGEMDAQVLYIEAYRTPTSS